jgi:DNA repair protein RecO (recombination protein O)
MDNPNRQTHRENEKLYRTEAVIIHGLNIGEADKILTVYTPHRGKLRLVAKGVRRTTSRLTGHLQQFTQTKLLVAKGRNLDIITQSEPVQIFRRLSGENFETYSFAAYAVDLLEKLTEEAQENFPAYQLLVETLIALEEGAEPSVVIRAYELHLLGYMGYRPQLQTCMRCNNELQPRLNYFSPEMGGVLCHDCGSAERRSMELSLDALKVLRYLQRTPFNSGPKLRVDEDLRRELDHLMRGYTRYLLERDLKSAEFLQSYI